jgi:DNA-directed RNA polymerase specialized sigma24 family protein
MTFDDLLREHGSALWRVIASYAPPGAERDDLAQDVLVAVWQHRR